MKAEGAALRIGRGRKLAIRLGPCGELQLRNSCFSELAAATEAAASFGFMEDLEPPTRKPEAPQP